jgi:hypothetical protein
MDGSWRSRLRIIFGSASGLFGMPLGTTTARIGHARLGEAA